MDPGTHNITIRRGLTWAGFVVADDATYDLTGCTAYAEIRKSEKGKVIYDLAPTIAEDGSDGRITIPPIDYADTRDLPAGEYYWDLILEFADGTRMESPLLAGTVTISIPITQPEPDA